MDLAKEEGRNSLAAPAYSTSLIVFMWNTEIVEAATGIAATAGCGTFVS